MPKYTRPNCVFHFLIFLALSVSATALNAADVWDGAAFSADPEALRRAAADIKPQKDMEATVFLNETRINFDASGKMVKNRHLIYRIENQEGVENWAEVRGRWEPWYQAKPEIRVRVITADGTVHTLDPKTLNDVPVHEDSPETYGDQRAYGGPLPALAPGAIVEEEVITRDTGLFFSGGAVERFGLAYSVPVIKTRFVLSHPQSTPVRYVLHQLPDATTIKTTNDGSEIITIEKGAMEAYLDSTPYAPGDAVIYPEIEVSTGNSWQQVATDYAHAVNEKVRLADVQPLLAKVDVKNGSRQEVIRRLVSALHKTVRYTGVEFGESALIPQFPSETLKRKYGDCKDKATLLVAMLRAAGIPANVALLDSGPGEDVNPELPGMGAFDHAIVYVPASGSDPELWIDATAQYTHVGDLLQMDYGRWALIADEKTTELKKIPELSSAQNVHIETRQVTLADHGPAKFVEINEGTGPRDADYRDYYRSDSKELRESNEKYVKQTYIADELTSFEKSDPADLEKPFSVTYVASGRRGYTDLNNASLYIRLEALMDGLPKYFYQKEEEQAKQNSDIPRRKPRTVDWVLSPFINEWRYKIAAPAGFKLRAVPVDKEEALGSARLTRHYKANSDGTLLEAVLRFEAGKGRLTPEEGKALRDAIVKAREAEPVAITFDQAGYSLLSQGKVKEALAIDRQLVAEHPKEALHRMRLAETLLAAGLGEKARSVAKEATVLDPKLAEAFNTLGWVLQHDLLGRLRHEGFDYDGAVAAYRKAIQLDPKAKNIRADYAILLDYDAEGIRYSRKAHLEDAISAYKELKKLDEDYFGQFEDNLLNDYWYTGKFKELGEYASTLPATDARRAFILASTAALDGTETAIKKSLEITSNEASRATALYTAGYLFLRLRKYPETADLYAAAVHGQSNSAQLAAFAEMARKTRRREDARTADSDPRSAVARLFEANMHTVTLEEILKVASNNLLKIYDKKELVERANKDFSGSRKKIEATQVPLDIAFDLALSNAKYSVEGDDNLGYHLIMQNPSAPVQHIFVVREEGQYKVVNLLEVIPELALQALERLDKNDVTGARKWLDWARENVHLGGGDDPLAGPVFPRFWTKGEEADAGAIRVAALTALVRTRYMTDHLPELVKARDNAKSDAERNNLNLALAYAYVQQERWTDLAVTSDALMKAYPDSLVAYTFSTVADMRLKKFDDWEKLLQTRLQKHPDEADYLRSQAQLEEYRNNPARARSIYKALIDSGKADDQDNNSYGWLALELPEPVDAESVELVEKANSLTKNSNFPIMHTLACLYAVQGKTKEARDLLLKAMDAADLAEPDSEVWFALGLIAEQYGEMDVARNLYTRVEKPKLDGPGSSYSFAQQHLAALPAAASGTTKVAAK